MFKFGDYVMYDPGYKDPELGRVTEDRGDQVMVCYHEGCTAASTPKEMLRLATEKEIHDSILHFGYHRFDGSCPKYDPDICYCCNFEENKTT